LPFSDCVILSVLGPSSAFHRNFPPDGEGETTRAQCVGRVNGMCSLVDSGCGSQTRCLPTRARECFDCGVASGALDLAPGWFSPGFAAFRAWCAFVVRRARRLQFSCSGSAAHCALQLHTAPFSRTLRSLSTTSYVRLYASPRSLFRVIERRIPKEPLQRPRSVACLDAVVA